MQQSSPTSLSPELHAAQADIDQWRAGNGRRRRIPESFWCQAIELAGRHSINSICEAMRLSHKGLTARVNGTSVSRPRSARFVELKPKVPFLGASSPPALSLRLGDGSSRHVDVTGVDCESACQLVAAFFGKAVTP